MHARYVHKNYLHFFMSVQSTLEFLHMSKLIDKDLILH